MSKVSDKQAGGYA